MPYISSDTMKAKRKELRTAFPGFKLSVTKSNHSGISVAFMEGPVKMTNSPEGYEQVNHFYLHDPSYSLDPFVAALLQKATDIASRGVHTVTVDSDYGNIPSFYVNLQIGKWNKPYTVRAK
jgi:hypothetical protein